MSDHELAAKKLATEAARIAGLFVVDAKSEGATLVTDCAADIKPMKVKWAWQNKIPLGKVAALAGTAGLGKSAVSLDLASHVSTGHDWPDGAPCEKGSVIVLSAEDDGADTIVPHLQAAGADLAKIHILRAVRRTRPNGEMYLDGFTLQRDIAALRETIARFDDLRLVVVDPVSAYLGAVDSHKNAEVRSVLAPLAQLAADFHVAVVLITHLNKAGDSALHRVMGSVAFVAAARAVWLFAKNPNDPTERLMFPGKLNLAPDQEGLTYKIEPRGDAIVVKWGHAVNVSADLVLGPETLDERSERAEAVEWLRERLSRGPVEVKKLEADARDARLAWRTVRRAKDAIGAVSSKDAFSSGWVWHLPQHGHEGGQPPTPSSLATLGAFEDGQPTKVATERDWTPSQKTKKEDEDVHTHTKMATGVVESGFTRDSEGPGVTCTSCSGHYGTFAGWRAHRLRGRCGQVVQ